jgi:predicted DNA-binding transcriptional regulator YafY
MKFIDYSEKLETIKYLAKHKRAGTPRRLAAKFNVSERTIQRMIQQLREHGCPIVFNRYRCTYEVKDISENF